MSGHPLILPLRSRMGIIEANNILFALKWLIREDSFPSTSSNDVGGSFLKLWRVLLIGPEEYTLRACPKLGEAFRSFPNGRRVGELRSIPHVACGFVQAQQVDTGIKIERRRILIKSSGDHHVSRPVMRLNS